MLEFLNQNAPLKFVIAFAIVLALIALTAWLVRRFAANRLGTSTRGRQPRLAVIDAASVDGRRRLVLIRRDNVEHLMMIGGPNDMVIEPNIVRAAPARAAADIAARPAAAAENGGTWPLQPAAEPPAVAPPQPRSYRSPVVDEPWVPTEPPLPRETAPVRPRPADSISGMAADFNAKLSADPDVPPPPRVAPMSSAPVREAAPAAPPQTDRNLAEMAQRLEAALRRPGAADLHPPVTDPLAAPPPPTPRPVEAPRAEARMEPKAEPKFEPRVEPKVEAKVEPIPAPKVEPRREPKVEARPEPKPEPAAAKNPFESLEEEMASLLGRSGKS